MKGIAFILVYCAALAGLHGWLKTADVPAPADMPVLVDTAAPRAGFVCTPSITPRIRRVHSMETV